MTLKTLFSSVAALGLMTAPAVAETTLRAVTFQHQGVEMAGTLVLPADLEPGRKLPTVVVTGAWTSVKEQMPMTYAREMAERGYAAFVFDFRGWGASGDLPQAIRYKEDPQAKIADIKAALEFVASLPEVDAARISGLGICASAGYMVDATSGNARIRSVALVAPWLQNAAIVNEVYGGAEGVAGLVAVSRAAEAKGGEIIPAAGPVGAEGVLMPLGGYYFEPSRGAIPEYDNKWNNLGWEGWLAYHPADSAATFDKPLKIVHSEAAAIPQGVRAFLGGMAGSAAVTWLDGIGQFDFYDQEQAVEAAADAVAAHFATAS
jgi:dienelactone hydrolase